MTADEEQLVKKLDAVKLECFIGILELVRHAASQNLASDKPDRAKALLDSEAEPLGIATDLEARVWNRVDGREQAVAAAAGRIRGRAEGLKREYNKLLGVCEGAILLHTADARRAEATEGLSSEELLKREELAAEDYEFVTLLPTSVVLTNSNGQLRPQVRPEQQQRARGSLAGSTRSLPLQHHQGSQAVRSLLIVTTLIRPPLVQCLRLLHSSGQSQRGFLPCPSSRHLVSRSC